MKSERKVELLPIQEVIDNLKAECEQHIRSEVDYYRKSLAERIEKVERNRPVWALLDAAGIDMYLSKHTTCDTDIELGFFPSTKAGSRELADKLRLIRGILECKLGLPSKRVANDKKGHIAFTLSPDAYPGIDICYTRRLPKGAKCKIVTQRSVYRSLVCEV
jgi:hypothetical protein